MTDINFQHAESEYNLRTLHQPLETHSNKKYSREHCQHCQQPQKNNHLTLSKKKSEGTISFGGLEQKDQLELQPTAKKEVKFQQWQPRHSPQKIYFTYHSPKKVQDQPLHHTQIHTVHHNSHNGQPFSLDFLRRKAGLPVVDSQKSQIFGSRFHTQCSHLAQEGQQSKDIIMSRYNNYQIGHRECDLCNRRTQQKPIIIENKIYKRNTSPIENRTSANRFITAPVVQSRYVASESQSHIPKASLSRCKFQSQGKFCQLCALSRRSNLQRLNSLNFNKFHSSKQGQDDQYNQRIEPESKISNINDTPERQCYHKYLQHPEIYKMTLNQPASTLRKDQNHLSKTKHVNNPQKTKMSSSFINTRKEPRLCYSITKKDLGVMKKEVLDRHQDKLKNLSDSAEKRRYTTPTKTFYSQIDPYSQRLKTYSEIHGFKTHQEGYSTNRRDVEFGWVRRSLENLAEDNSKLPRSRSKQLHSNHKSVRSYLRLYELQPDARRWYHANRRGIEFQSDLIFSYDLIRRSMTDDQIGERLQTFIVEMIDPKHWLSLMVDEVYDKFKQKSRQYRHY